MAESFYERDGVNYLATELTRGPWDPRHQHAGPPAALVGREIERLGGGRIGGPEGPPAHVGRITYELMRPIPIGPMRVSAEVARPGRRVEMVEATLRDGEDELLMRARGWRLRSERVAFERPPGISAPPPGPERGEPGGYFATGETGFQDGMEGRFLSGAFMDPGPATVWMRMKVPLVAGEAPAPLQRVLIAADSGNGVSAPLDWRRYLFVNVDLSVHLSRMPAGEWVCLDAVTVPERDGVGLSDTALYDELGPIGRAAQTLLVAEREPR